MGRDPTNVFITSTTRRGRATCLRNRVPSVDVEANKATSDGWSRTTQEVTSTGDKAPNAPHAHCNGLFRKDLFFSSFVCPSTRQRQR